MRQILCNNSSGALVARMPKPIVEPGTVLVRVHYSLISVGTEIAPLRAVVTLDEGGTPFKRAIGYSKQAQSYLHKAIRDPRKALSRIKREGEKILEKILPQDDMMGEVFQKLTLKDLKWTLCNAVDFQIGEQRLDLTTDNSSASYQVMSHPIVIPEGCVPILTIQGHIHQGSINVGFLNDQQDAWLGSRTYHVGALDDRLIVNIAQSKQVSLVMANAGSLSSSRVSIHHMAIEMAPPTENGLPHSELEDQGWNVGYSTAGEVVAVGDGVRDIMPGDFVACAGAGQANHADFVSVKRNLVCRIPQKCETKLAATTTVGAIALQGVRRAAPQLGERICVIGLGLIGQMTSQMLVASGCQVFGLDRDIRRVNKAKNLGMNHGSDDGETFKKIVRDFTNGWGVDQTIITAATKSDEVINLAMEVTRAKGRVVIVGDVGLNVQRALFYRKEIDLLMSTSYGPGRYDRTYEEEGRDYPFPYVRWTLNRNMEAYLEMVASGKLNIEQLIERVVSVGDVPKVYRELAMNKESLPLGVLIQYSADSSGFGDSGESTSIRIRGHKKAVAGPIPYALVGAGAFGTSMLVPMMEKCTDRFFLLGVVSCDTTRGGNFARGKRVEFFTTELETALQDPEFDLMVIATRHNQHADQVVASLKEGKHVFVEKPLALSWDELDYVVKSYQALTVPPLLMVGFNRRFSPALQVLSDTLGQRRSPLMINYRLNGGYIPLDSWIQGNQGGGRNLGEACHMYDVFRFLARSPVASISATSIGPGSLPYQRNDNFCASLFYEDGSVGNLVYTALGPKQGMPKEYIEVFCDGEAYIVNDYKSLVRAGDGKILWQSDEVDKGHFEEIQRFGEAISQEKDSPIPFSEIVETTAIALHIEDLIYGKHEDSDQ